MAVVHPDGDLYGHGHNEELLAGVLSVRRDDAVIATKFGYRFGRETDSTSRYIDSSPSRVGQACDASLKRLGVDHIDLYYLHRRNPSVPIEDTVGAMGELVDAGKVARIGLSEVSIETLRAASRIRRIDAVQMEYSLFTREVESGMLATCREVGAALVAYAPVGRGWLTGAITDRAQLREGDVRLEHPRLSQAQRREPAHSRPIGAHATRRCGDRVSDYVSANYDRSALVVIDVQKDFIDGAMPVAGTSEVLPRLAGLTASFRSAGRPIAHVIRLYPPGGTDVDLARRGDIEAGATLVAPGTGGADIPSALLPDSAPIILQTEALLSGAPQELCDNEAIWYKPRWSAFHRTDLEAWLRARDVDTVVVAGCNLPNCPRATLFDASERDLRTVLVADAVSQTTAERLADLQLIGVNLSTTADVVSALTDGGRVRNPSLS